MPDRGHEQKTDVKNVKASCVQSGWACNVQRGTRGRSREPAADTNTLTGKQFNSGSAQSERVCSVFVAVVVVVVDDDAVVLYSPLWREGEEGVGGGRQLSVRINEYFFMIPRPKG